MNKLEELELFIIDLISAIKLPSLKISNEKEREKFINEHKPTIINGFNSFIENWK